MNVTKQRKPSFANIVALTSIGAMPERNTLDSGHLYQRAKIEPTGSFTLPNTVGVQGVILAATWPYGLRSTDDTP